MSIGRVDPSYPLDKFHRVRTIEYIPEHKLTVVRGIETYSREIDES